MNYALFMDGEWGGDSKIINLRNVYDRCDGRRKFVFFWNEVSQLITEKMDE